MELPLKVVSHVHPDAMKGPAPFGWCAMGSKIRILCVDDDEEVLFVTRDLLELRGYEVAAVTNGRAAMARVREGYDLVIVDYNLPDVDGGTVAKHWKREHPSVPILMVSGCPDLPEKARQHVNGYLCKGVPMDCLFGAISQLTNTGFWRPQSHHSRSEGERLTGGPLLS